MGRAELGAIENGGVGEATGDMFYRLGMMYSVGGEVPADYVTAHKWFNLAAMRGNDDAKQHRSEISREMTKPEVARAQRLAREWISRH